MFLHLVPDNEPPIDLVLPPETGEALHTIRRQLVHEKLGPVDLGRALVVALHLATRTTPPAESVAAEVGHE